MTNLKQEKQDLTEDFQQKCDEITRKYCIEMEKLELSILINGLECYDDEGSYDSTYEFAFISKELAEVLLSDDSFDELTALIDHHNDNSSVTKNKIKELNLDLSMSDDFDHFGALYSEVGHWTIVQFQDGRYLTKTLDHSVEDIEMDYE